MQTCGSKYITTWKFIEISIFIFASIGVVPEVSRHAWKWLNTNEFTALAVHWLAFIETSTYQQHSAHRLLLLFSLFSC